MNQDQIANLILWLRKVGQGQLADRLPGYIEIAKRPDFDELLKAEHES